MVDENLNGTPPSILTLFPAVIVKFVDAVNCATPSPDPWSNESITAFLISTAVVEL